jgi:hypothetical protein
MIQVFEVEHVKQLRDPGHGTGGALSGLPDPEVGPDLGGVRQLAGGPIHGDQAEPLPDAGRKLVIEVGHLRAVQLDKGGIVELLAGLAERALGDHPHRHRLRVLELEELVQLILQGAFDQIEQEEDDDGKRQTPVAGEIVLVPPVAGFEVLRIEHRLEVREETLELRGGIGVHTAFLYTK